MRGPSGDTVNDWRRYLYRRLGTAGLVFGHGAPNAAVEADWLLSAVVDIEFERIGTFGERRVSKRNRSRMLRILERRIHGRVPLAYLLEEAWLAGKRFKVDPRVIVPRSFIAELLSEALVPWLPPEGVKRAMDLCTGSGCLAILLADRFPGVSVDAVDLSLDALQIARENVRAHRMDGRVRLLHSDLFSAVPRRKYDLIVANPPYVSDSAMRRLPQEYRHEPRMALEADADGLAVVLRILETSHAHLSRHGILVCEIGHRRKGLEMARPRTPFVWLEAGGSRNHVFLLTREDLVSLGTGQLCSN